MLENLRFDQRETSKDDAQRGLFADELAALADLYVSDGFGVLHRKQASVYDIALRLPHAAGYLVRAEVGALRRLTADIRRPYVVVLGGAKVEDKFDAIGDLVSVADRILIGGAMAFPFLAAQGYKVGTSLLAAEQVDVAQRLPGPGRPGRRDDRAAVRPRGGGRTGRRRAARGRRRRRHPGGPDGPGHRAGVGQAVYAPASAAPGRSSGTARWASSSWPRTPAAPGPSPRR